MKFKKIEGKISGWFYSIGSCISSNVYLARKWERREGCGGYYLGTPSGESFLLRIWKTREFPLGKEKDKGKGGNKRKFMIHDTNNRDSAAILVPQYFMPPNENL